MTCIIYSKSICCKFPICIPRGIIKTSAVTSCVIIHQVIMMIIISPNSRARKGKKEKGEVKGEYGGVCGEEEGIVI